MKVSIVGSGNVATVLGRMMKNCGHSIVEITSKHISHAEVLASELNANANDDLLQISGDSNILVVAVSDSALPLVCETLKLDDKIVVHTSGAESIDILKRTSSSYGVLYPLQSLRKEIKSIPVIPVLIDGNNESVKKRIKSFASSLTNMVAEANDNYRLKIHLAAVVSSNFTNHLFALTKSFCEKEKVDFNLIVPLIKEVAERSQKFNPAEMQTGPAIRNDEITIEKHLEMLRNNEQLKELYEILTKSIQDFSG